MLIARPVEPMSYRISHPQTFSSVILWLQLAPHCVWVAALRVRCIMGDGKANRWFAGGHLPLLLRGIILPKQGAQGRDLSTSASSSTSATGRIGAVPLQDSQPPCKSARHDAPVLRYTTGARAISGGPLDRGKLLCDLRKDVQARTAQDSSVSLLNTWSFFHERWFGQRVKPFPMEPEFIEAIAAQMKAQGYRSFDNYLSRAKKEHIKSGGDWTPLLHLTWKECAASVNRGRGPSRQSAPLDLAAVYALSTGILLSSPVVPGGPMCPVHLIILGSFFLTRELELACARYQHLSIGQGKVTWVLPATKTDVHAIGVTRSWGCICGGEAKPCPYHAAVWLRDALQVHFGDRVMEIDFPLFPTLAGGTVSKASVVDTFEHFAVLIGAPLVDTLGRRSYGGHSLRVTGAQYLAKMGLELYKLALLARWHSAIIVRYVGDAPLESVTDDCRRLVQGASLDQMLQRVQLDVDAGIRSIKDLGLELALALDERAASQESTETIGRIVENTKNGAFHYAVIYGPQIPRAEWKCKCKWLFGLASHVLHAELPFEADADHVCGICLYQEKACRKRTAHVNSEDSCGSEGTD